jgi:hypothetical protein
MALLRDKLRFVKYIRIFIVLAFVGPMMSVASDLCCANTEVAHTTQGVGSDSSAHLSQADDCCNGTTCAECTLCHLQSFFPTCDQASYRHAMSDRDTTPLFAPFTEIVSTVLTPPPTH